MAPRSQGWIIFHDAGSDLWRQITTVVARTSDEAIRLASSGENYACGTFLAFPVKWWTGQVTIECPDQKKSDWPVPAALPEDYWESAQ